jgi:hypothetical protein
LTSATNGKPDLSGVWHVEATSLAEMQRLFGNDVGTTSVPGMEVDTISKHAINILLDFKPEGFRRIRTSWSISAPKTRKTVSTWEPGRFSGRL